MMTSDDGSVENNGDRFGSQETAAIRTLGRTDCAVAAVAPATVSQHINALQRLDKKYDNLRAMENNNEKYLQQVQQEEASLMLALEQSSTSLKEQREKETKKKDEEAVARLEEALMMDDDSSRQVSSLV